jgi:hypothetical protein
MNNIEENSRIFETSKNYLIIDFFGMHFPAVLAALPLFPTS